MTDLPLRFCRFCKDETKQLIAENNPHNRVCIKCWRRQRDGERVEIADGERLSERARDSKPPSIPPPPLVPREYVLREDFNDALRRIEALERQTGAIGQRMNGVDAITKLYK